MGGGAGGRGGGGGAAAKTRRGRSACGGVGHIECVTPLCELCALWSSRTPKFKSTATLSLRGSLPARAVPAPCGGAPRAPPGALPDRQRTARRKAALDRRPASSPRGPRGARASVPTRPRPPPAPPAPAPPPARTPQARDALYVSRSPGLPDPARRRARGGRAGPAAAHARVANAPAGIARSEGRHSTPT